MSEQYYLAIVEVTAENGDKSLVPVSYMCEGVTVNSEKELHINILDKMQGNYKTKRVKLLLPITRDQFNCLLQN